MNATILYVFRMKAGKHAVDGRFNIQTQEEII